jgi:hypothetical protein
MFLRRPCGPDRLPHWVPRTTATLERVTRRFIGAPDQCAVVIDTPVIAADFFCPGQTHRKHDRRISGRPNEKQLSEAQTERHQ